MNNFDFYINKNKTEYEKMTGRSLSCFTQEAVKEVYAFHKGMPEYAETPLNSLSSLAEELGVSQFLVKDESKRFGLNAFKALGGSYAIARYLCDRFGLPMNENTYNLFHSDEIKDKISGMIFVTATDGNHGRGVAWTAKILGCKAIVYMPKGSAQERLENIRKLGAEAEITDMNYDDSVRYASKVAEDNGYVLIQDTSWDGYEAIPTAIMQGYTTMAQEICEQITGNGWEVPTHLFLQAGVGAMAGAIAGFFTNYWKEECPRIIVVEPDQADCIYRTASADDGKMHIVTGDMNSMMAGLCCGEPCPIGWDILKQAATAFISCDDSYSAYGMRILGRPMGVDANIISGESGAVTTGTAASIMKNHDEKTAELRKMLGLDENSRILVISTEGDTDRINYERILSE